MILVKYAVCPFCASELKVNNRGLAPKCDFCGADLRDKQRGCLRLVSEEGERFTFHKMKPNVFEEHAKQSVEVLKTYHTFDLYIVLKEVRDARQLAYNAFQIFKEAAKDAPEFRESAAEQQAELNEWTKRMYVIENILLERQGFFPAKVTDKVLQYMWEQIKESKKKRMQVYKNDSSNQAYTKAN